MAESTTEEQVPTPVTDGDDDELTPGYKPPAKKDLKTLQELDADDESLVKYKQQLLGQTTDVLNEGGNNVLVKKLIIAPEGRDEIVIDLTKDVSKIKNTKVLLKEGCQYRVKVEFRVQKDIVSGLRYKQNTYKGAVRVDKSNLMVGSYGPKSEAHVYQTPMEEAPSGLLARGSYKVKSCFTDDDKNIFLEWEWAIEVKKEWA